MADIAPVISLEDHRSRLMAEGEALVRADEAATGAQLVAMWRDGLTRSTDPTEVVMRLVADVADEILGSDDIAAAAEQLANGARMAALMRARRGIR